MNCAPKLLPAAMPLTPQSDHSQITVFLKRTENFNKKYTKPSKLYNIPISLTVDGPKTAQMNSKKQSKVKKFYHYWKPPQKVSYPYCIEGLHLKSSIYIFKRTATKKTGTFLRIAGLTKNAKF